VVLNDTQTIDEGQRIAEELMQQLQIDRECLLPGAYMDLLLEKA
jgi:adenylate cyclase class IV